MRSFAAGVVTGAPSTVSPSKLPPTSPCAAVCPAEARALAETFAATISPSKSDRPETSAAAEADEAEPDVAEVLALIAPVVTAEPSAGYWKLGVENPPRGGDETSATVTAGRPGSTTLTANALAAAPPARPPAGEALPATKSSASTASPDTARLGTMGVCRPRGLAPPRPPGELRRDGQQQHREELPQHVLVQGRRDPDSAGDRRRSRRAPSTSELRQRTLP